MPNLLRKRGKKSYICLEIKHKVRKPRDVNFVKEAFKHMGKATQNCVTLWDALSCFLTETLMSDKPGTMPYFRKAPGQQVRPHTAKCQNQEPRKDLKCHQIPHHSSSLPADDPCTVTSWLAKTAGCLWTKRAEKNRIHYGVPWENQVLH